MTAPARFEVWGDPISHSRSPAIHTAAYARLGLPWTYGRRRVDEESFGDELAGLADDLLGLSLTMPLKTRAHEIAVRRDAAATATGAVNTLRRSDDGWDGFNTDVGGLAQALREFGAEGAQLARIVGAGATATSALAALADLGVARVEVSARRPEAAAALHPLAERLGIDLGVTTLDAAARPVDLTVSTLPGDAPLPPDTAARLAEHGGRLFDVVYGTWPTALGAAWLEHGAPAVPGTTMLLHQAVLQIRIFATGDPTRVLPDEDAVVAVMRSALVGG